MGGYRRRAGLAVALAVALLVACSLPRWPVEGTVTSPYGLRLNGWWPALHHGIDVAAPPGTPVRAMASGRVVHAGWLGGYGLTVMLDHGGGLVTLYAHLAEIRVEPGRGVEGRDVVGLVGQTGNATGPHLHFEIRRRGRAEDPVPLLGGFPPPRGR